MYDMLKRHSIATMYLGKRKGSCSLLCVCRGERDRERERFMMIPLIEVYYENANAI